MAVQKKKYECPNAVRVQGRSDFIFCKKRMKPKADYSKQENCYRDMCMYVYYCRQEGRLMNDPKAKDYCILAEEAEEQ